MISVQYLWLIYVGALIILGIVFGVVIAKSKNIGYSFAVLLTTLLAGLVVYLTAMYNVDPDSLSASDLTSLNALYLTILILIALSFFLCIIELAMKSSKAIKNTVTTHMKMECDKESGDCEVKNVKVEEKTKETKSTTKYECEDNECSPTEYFLKNRNTGSTVHISYLA